MAEQMVLAGIEILLLAIIFATILVLWRKLSTISSSWDNRLVEPLRAEGEQTRRALSEDARDQRQELSSNLRDTRTELQSDIRRFKEEVDSKLSSELKRLGDEATTNRDKLRETISTRLDEFSGAQAKAARDLREEVAGSIQKLQEGILKASSDQREAQATQFSGFGQILNAVAEGLNIALANLAAAIEEKQAKLTTTVDTKLKEVAEISTNSSAAFREEVNGIFKRLGDALTQTINQMSDHQKERLATVDQTVSQLSTKNQEAMDALKTAVEERLNTLQQSNANKLDEIRKTVDEQLQQTLQERLTSSFKLVSDQLEQVYRGLGEMQKLADGVGDLKRVLANVKTRGIYGEVQLAALIEQVFSEGQYVANAQVRQNSQERVEYALRLPGRDTDADVLLPIDSKFPIEDYDRLHEAALRGDPDGVAEAGDYLEGRIRSFAKDIGDKYVNPPTTTDLAILFLPTEGLYAEVIRRPSLAEALMEKHRVTVAGPSTLLAMLSAFRMALRAVAVQKRSTEVWHVLSAVKTEFGKYGKVVTKLQSQLETSLRTVDELGTRTRVMNRRLGDVEEVAIDPAEAQKLLGIPEEPAEAV